MSKDGQKDKTIMPRSAPAEVAGRMTAKGAVGNLTKKWRTILADPPWDILQRGNHGAHKHYGLMSMERIKAMPIQGLARDNAHCWLWVTNGALRYGYEVLEAWGFTHRSTFTWIKPHYTLGVYLRNATEHILFGTRGKAPVKFHGQATWGFYPLQDHSHKPEEVYDLIERVSDGPYLELFARRKRHGWDSWGNEVESDTAITGYPVPHYKTNIPPNVVDQISTALDTVKKNHQNTERTKRAERTEKVERTESEVK